ncbi:MAG TPA: hypothetical protein VIH60_04805 [Steroidobacteraceae bacterium]
MADGPEYGFYPELSIQSPDILGSYLRGLSAAGQLQAQQQENQLRGLNIDQLQMAMQKQQFLNQVGMQQVSQGMGVTGGTPGVGQGAPSVGRTGGIQNGPQDAVAGSAGTPPSPASSYDGSAPVTGLGTGPSAGTQLGLAILTGKYDPGKTEAAIFENQKQQAQFKASPYMDLADSVATSPNADQLIRNNPFLQQQWVKFAPALGLDPFKDLNPQNARAVARFGGNQLAGSVGLPGKPMPEQYYQQNMPNGQIAQFDSSGKFQANVRAPEVPTYSVEKSYDVNSGQNVGQKVQTGGWGAGAAGGPGSGGINLGYTAPTAENVKSAGFAAALRGSLGTMRQMEGSGYALSPSDRAQLINVASDEDPGLLHQWVSQELLSHKLSPQGQTYLTASMAAVQALSHDQSGARLNPGTIRANLEAAIPVDVNNKTAMQQIESFRDGYYKDTLVGAGPIAHTPAFQGTLGADLDAISAGKPFGVNTSQSATTKTIGGKTYVSLGGGRWAQQ